MALVLFIAFFIAVVDGGVSNVTAALCEQLAFLNLTTTASSCEVLMQNFDAINVMRALSFVFITTYVSLGVTCIAGSAMLLAKAVKMCIKMKR